MHHFSHYLESERENVKERKTGACKTRKREIHDFGFQSCQTRPPCNGLRRQMGWFGAKIRLPEVFKWPSSLTNFLYPRADHKQQDGEKGRSLVNHMWQSYGGRKGDAFFGALSITSYFMATPPPPARFASFARRLFGCCAKMRFYAVYSCCVL